MEAVEQEKLDRENVLEKIRKLAAFNKENATEAEVELAALHIQKLLRKYNLSMFDVESKQMKDGVSQSEFQTDYKKPPNDVKHFICNIAAAYNCQLIFSWGTHKRTGKYGVKYIFVGAKMDAEVAAYMFVVLYEKLANLAIEMADQKGMSRNEKRDYCSSFLMGAGMEIKRRLKEDDRDNLLNTQVGQSYAIVLRDNIKDYIAKEFPVLKNMPISGEISNYSGMNDGRVAGQNVELRQGITGQNRSTKRLN